MFLKYLKITALALLGFSGLPGCSKKEAPVQMASANMERTLMAEIAGRSDLSVLAGLLVKSGLDKELLSSKAYTVWAPTNAALQGLDPALAQDSARLRQFLSNHIALLPYYAGRAGSEKVALINGKYVAFNGNSFGTAPLVGRDYTVRNGVLHIIGATVAPLPNAWEFINATAAQYRQNALIVGENYFVRDAATSIIDSIGANGQPIYRPGVGLVARNRFADNVYDLQKEDAGYTYFLFTDAALRVEADSLAPFYRLGTADSTFRLSALNVIKDAVVEGVHTKEALPAQLVSKFGVPIPVNKADITASYPLSNGIVHVVGKLDFLTRNKVPSIVVQGENARGFFRPDGTSVNVRGTTFYRQRISPVTNQMFTDLFVYNHGIANLNVQYQVPEVAAARYKVYWVAVNDTLRVNGTINPVQFQQRLAMGSRTAPNFPLRNVPVNTYTEVELGEYVHPAFGPLEFYLTAANSTAANVNTLSLDYVRLVPQF